VGSGVVGGVEDGLSLFADRVGSAVVDVGWGVEPGAGVAVLVVVVLEESVDEGPALGEGCELFGEPRRVFEGLELGFAVGVVVGDAGRLCDWRTPRSARSWDTVFEVIELPRSACRVSWPWGTWWRWIASAMSSSARRADSRGATSQLTA